MFRIFLLDQGIPTIFTHTPPNHLYNPEYPDVVTYKSYDIKSELRFYICLPTWKKSKKFNLKIWTQTSPITLMLPLKIELPSMMRTRHVGNHF